MSETNKYPLPNGCRDEIDQWLWDEMQLLPGCCSSIASLEYDIAREVAEKLWIKWHNSNEEQPDGRRAVLAVNANYEGDVHIYTNLFSDHIWAYIEDVLPKKGI